MTALDGLSEQQLVKLLQLRPDLASPPPRDMAALAARAATWSSINAATSSLTLVGQQVLDGLCLLPQPTTVASLAALLGGGTDPADLEPILGQLADLAVVFRSDGALRLHPQFVGLPYPAKLGPPAGAILGAEPPTMLQSIARRLGVAPGRSKGEMAAAVAHALGQPSVVERVVREGPAGTAELAARLAEHYPVGTVPNGTYNVRADSSLGWLIACGLVARLDWDTVVMPREVALALRGGRPFPDFTLHPPAIEWLPVDAEGVDVASREQALRLVDDIATVLGLWQGSPPKLLKAGGIGVRDVRRTAAAIGRPETDTARIIELAAVTDLAGWDEMAVLALPRPGFDAWLTMDSAERWGALVGAWLNSRVDLSLAEPLGTGDKPIPPLMGRMPISSARRRRRLVLTALAEGEVGQAANVETLTERVEWDAPAAWTGGHAMGRVLVASVRGEAEMLGLVAFGALSTIGRLAVRGEMAQAIGWLSAHSPPVTSEFVIQADLTAVAAGQLSSSVRDELKLMADVESSGAATVFRIGEPSLRRAFDAGRTATEILGFFEAHATRGVPQPLKYLVEDMGRRHGRLRLGGASCYLRSDDPALLAEILVARRAAKLGFQQLAPTVLASPAPARTVLDVLRASGYLPALEDSTGALVVTRPPAPRAPAGPPGALSGSARVADQVAAPADAAALAQRLMSTRPKPVPAGPPPPSVPAGPPRFGPAPIHPLSPEAPFSQMDLIQDVPFRPPEIAKAAVAILELLEWAGEEQWIVRLEYRHESGTTEQFNAVSLGHDGTDATVMAVPDCDLRSLDVERIQWVRVLTEAEEDAL